MLSSAGSTAVGEEAGQGGGDLHKVIKAQREERKGREVTSQEK